MFEPLLGQAEQTMRDEVESGGLRSDRIRTYNWADDRVTDHRIDLTLYNLPTFIEGEIEEVVSALLANDLKERLAALE